MWGFFNNVILREFHERRIQRITGFFTSFKMTILDDTAEVLDGAGTREDDCIGALDGLAFPFGEFCYGKRLVDHPAGRLR